MNTNSKVKAASAALAFGITFLAPAWAHKGLHHVQPELTPPNAEALREAERAVNADFNQTVRPIMAAKCFSCHASNQGLPWYASLPIVSGIIRRDINESKEHLDMSAGFPFGGHGSDAEDLLAISDSVSDGSMPPLRYRLVHWQSGLSIGEQQAILDWVSRSKNRLVATQSAR